MKRVRMFLAASSELENDRKEFEIFINRENKALVKRDIFLELVIWEDFMDSMSKTRLQDEYNNAIIRCDIFIMLFYRKVGKYTAEEFEVAFGHFKKTGKPLIYTYFKDGTIRASEINKEDINSLLQFQEQLSSLGHYYTTYTNIDSLKYQFSNQINKLYETNWSSPLDQAQPEKEDRKNKVFISYSHKDKEFLDRILIHLRPLTNDGVIDIWVDTKLTAGEKWKTKIEEALQSASVAILLVSADFLASDFIVNNELPPLLDAAEKKGTQIIPVIIKPCRFTRDKKLSLYQVINSPDKPLMGLSEFEQEKIYDKIAEWVEMNFK